MQAKKDTQKKLLFKFVDEESDDYFKRTEENELQFDGGDDDGKTKKMVGGLVAVLVLGLVLFFVLKKPACVDDPETPDVDECAAPEVPEAGEEEVPETTE